MILIGGVKYACLECIRGHRSTLCQHDMRPLLLVKKKGRPNFLYPDGNKNYRIAVFAEEVAEDCREAGPERSRERPVIISKASDKYVFDIKSGEIVGPYCEEKQRSKPVQGENFVNISSCCQDSLKPRGCLCNQKKVLKKRILQSYLKKNPQKDVRRLLRDMQVKREFKEENGHVLARGGTSSSVSGSYGGGGMGRSDASRAISGAENAAVGKNKHGGFCCGPLSLEEPLLCGTFSGPLQNTSVPKKLGAPLQKHDNGGLDARCDASGASSGLHCASLPKDQQEPLPNAYMNAGLQLPFHDASQGPETMQMLLAHHVAQNMVPKLYVRAYAAAPFVNTEMRANSATYGANELDLSSVGTDALVISAMRLKAPQDGSLFDYSAFQRSFLEYASRTPASDFLVGDKNRVFKVINVPSCSVCGTYLCSADCSCPQCESHNGAAGQERDQGDAYAGLQTAYAQIADPALRVPLPGQGHVFPCSQHMHASVPPPGYVLPDLLMSCHVLPPNQAPLSSLNAPGQPMQPQMQNHMHNIMSQMQNASAQSQISYGDPRTAGRAFCGRNDYSSFLRLILSEDPDDPWDDTNADSEQLVEPDLCSCPEGSCFCFNCERHGIIEGVNLDDIFGSVGKGQN